MLDSSKNDRIFRGSLTDNGVNFPAPKNARGNPFRDLRRVSDLMAQAGTGVPTALVGAKYCALISWTGYAELRVRGSFYVGRLTFRALRNKQTNSRVDACARDSRGTSGRQRSEWSTDGYKITRFIIPPIINFSTESGRPIVDFNF
jgi:hypothetical protein